MVEGVHLLTSTDCVEKHLIIKLKEVQQATIVGPDRVVIAGLEVLCVAGLVDEAAKVGSLSR